MTAVLTKKDRLHSQTCRHLCHKASGATMPFVAADVFSHDERAMSSTRTVDSPGIIGWVSRAAA